MFVLILQHPVTLNIATPKDYSWMYYTDRSVPSAAISSLPSSGLLGAQKKLTHMQVGSVASHFLQLMTHDNSTNNDNRYTYLIFVCALPYLYLDMCHTYINSNYDNRSPTCSMGWLPAMTLLRAQLEKDPLSQRDVRIGMYGFIVCLLCCLFFW
jgi:hypothetical protein